MGSPTPRGRPHLPPRRVPSQSGRSESAPPLQTSHEQVPLICVHTDHALAGRLPMRRDSGDLISRTSFRDSTVAGQPPYVLICAAETKKEPFSKHDRRRIKVNEFRNLVVELICRCIGRIRVAKRGTTSMFLSSHGTSDPARNRSWACNLFQVPLTQQSEAMFSVLGGKRVAPPGSG